MGGSQYRRVATPSKTDHLIVLLLSHVLLSSLHTPHTHADIKHMVQCPHQPGTRDQRPVSVGVLSPPPPQGRTRPPRLTGRQSALDTLTSGHLTFAGLDLVLGKQEQCCREWRPVLTIATPSDLDTVTKPQPTLPLNEYQFSVLGF